MYEGGLRGHLLDYCQSTSIHGIKYLGEQGRPLLERLWWVAVFVVSCYGSFSMIERVWTKWNENPVIVSFAETTTPVWQIPFPAVTICPETSFKASLFNFTANLEAFNSGRLNDSRSIELLGQTSLLCSQYVIINGTEQNTLDPADLEALKQMAPKMEETMAQCWWRDRKTDCASLFSPVITEEGVCFTFNMVETPGIYSPPKGSVDRGWSLEGGYTKASGSLERGYPKRTSDAGTRAGLFLVLLANNAEFDPSCRGAVPGFKIGLHSPADVPSVGFKYLRAPYNQEVLISVEPDIMTTSDTLRSYSETARQCYFPSERRLSLFSNYTQSNCRLECLANTTLASCGCTAHYMPRVRGAPICGPSLKHCLILSIREQWDKCDCLSSCTSLRFDTEISQANFDLEKLLTVHDREFPDLEGYSMTRVTVFFKEMQFITSRRSELFGPVEFLANCGGLLSLFSGLSLLSLVELIYYLTLRLYVTLRRPVRSRSIAIQTEDSGRVEPTPSPDPSEPDSGSTGAAIPGDILPEDKSPIRP